MPHPVARPVLGLYFPSNRALRELLLPRARAMRANPTPSEALLWRELRARKLGVKFRRQHPLGPFILDFYAPEVALVVEVDGAVHRGREHLDCGRDVVLGLAGLRVLRVPAWRVERDLEDVLCLVRRAIGTP